MARDVIGHLSAKNDRNAARELKREIKRPYQIPLTNTSIHYSVRRWQFSFAVNTRVGQSVDNEPYGII